MGRAAVRAAATSYFAGKTLPFVGTVMSARPLIVDENDFDAAMAQWALQQSPPLNDAQSSAVVIVNLPDSQRQRKTLTGRNFVDDTNVHEVTLEVIFANQSGDGIQAQADHDTLVDAIVVAIRSDPLLGQPSTVWSAGEFQAGVRVQQHEPFTGEDGTTIFIIATVRFETWEWIAGTGV